MASQAIKRQRKRRRADTDGDPEFQVAPMVDVLLVLMLFFMAITSTEVLKKDKNLKLADADKAKQAKQNEKRNEILVNVSWNGLDDTPSFSMNQHVYATAADIAAELASEHNLRPTASVVIRADRDAQYSNISDLMKVCGDAGVSTVTFSVLIGGDKDKKGE